MTWGPLTDAQIAHERHELDCAVRFYSQNRWDPSHVKREQLLATVDADRATIAHLTDMLRELWDLVPAVDRMCPCSDTATRSDCVRCGVRAVVEDAERITG